MWLQHQGLLPPGSVIKLFGELIGVVEAPGAPPPDSIIKLFGELICVVEAPGAPPLGLVQRKYNASHEMLNTYLSIRDITRGPAHNKGTFIDSGDFLEALLRLLFTTVPQDLGFLLSPFLKFTAPIDISRILKSPISHYFKRYMWKTTSIPD